MTARPKCPRPSPATVAAVLAVLLAALAAQDATAPAVSVQPLAGLESGEPVPGGMSVLVRGDDEIATEVTTTAEPGDAVTMWYVVFNAPTECSDAVCDEDDVFVDGMPAKGFDTDRIEAVRVSVVFAGGGAVVDEDGRLTLSGGLAEGEVPDGPAQVVIGNADDDPIQAGPVTGIEDARAAEVHVVLQSHGAAHEDPDLLAEQLSGFRTNCNPDCVDIQAAIHR